MDRAERRSRRRADVPVRVLGPAIERGRPGASRERVPDRGARAPPFPAGGRRRVALGHAVMRHRARSIPVSGNGRHGRIYRPGCEEMRIAIRVVEHHGLHDRTRIHVFEAVHPDFRRTGTVVIRCQALQNDVTPHPRIVEKDLLRRTRVRKMGAQGQASRGDRRAPVRRSARQRIRDIQVEIPDTPLIIRDIADVFEPADGISVRHIQPQPAGIVTVSVDTLQDHVASDPWSREGRRVGSGLVIGKRPLREDRASIRFVR